MKFVLFLQALSGYPQQPRLLKASRQPMPTTYAPVSRPAPLPLERKAVGSPTSIRQRAGSCQSPVEFLTSSPNTSPSKFSPPSFSAELLATHRKLERSFSEPISQQTVDNRPSKSSNINPSRYKTEMCRPYEESGHCKYGDKCQFAHGAHELRNLARHPKYKTDLCRTFHTIGFCPYGPRCHFIHNEDEHKLNYIIQQKQQQAVQQAVAQQAHQVHLQQQHLLQQQLASTPAPIQRPKLHLTTSYSRDMLGSTADSPPITPPDSVTSESPQSLSPTSGLCDHDVFSLHEFSSALSNMPITTPTPIMTPLNVQTDSFASMLAELTAALAAPTTTATSTAPSSVANDSSAGSSLNNSFHNTSDLLNAPPSPPESINGEDELVRALRLPFFSQLDGRH